MRRRIGLFATALFRRGARDRELNDEFALHLELRTADLIRMGRSPDDAARQARIEFGNLTSAKETMRTSWGTAWIDRVGQDMKYAIRTLRKNPGFTAIAVLSLGVGIGATTTMFSVIDAFNFRSLPYREPDALVWLSEITPRDDGVCARCAELTAPATAVDWATNARSFESIGAFANGEFGWDHNDDTETIATTQATPGFFAMLGVHPVRGRDFVAADTGAGAEPVIVVSYDFWQTRLGADAAVVGRRLPSASRPATIIGVLPRDFHFRDNARVWTPLRLDATSSRANRRLFVIARLAPDHTITQANADVATISAQLALAWPDAYRDWGTRAQPLRDMFTIMVGRGPMVLFAITVLVLLIAALNVAGLLLSRAVARRQEIALRGALGANRGRLIRQMLVEGACIGGAGGAVGVGLALWSIRFVPRWFSIESAGLAVAIDYRMLAFAATVSIAVGMAAAIAPALRSTARDAGDALRSRPGDVSLKSRRTSNTLIATQIALALTLLTAAGLLSRDFVELRYLDLGFDPDGLFHTGIAQQDTKAADRATWSRAASDVRSRVAAIPGVLSASLEYRSAIHPAIVRPDSAVSTSSSTTPKVKAVDPEYFATFGTRLLKGRPFAASDGRGAPLVAIVNRSAAERFWPGRSAIGRQVFVGDSASVGEFLTVVGVSANAERGELIERHWPMVYRPFQQATIYHTAASVYVRVSRADALVGARQAIREVTGTAPTPFASDLDRLSRRLLARKFNAIALDVFAAFGLLLASMGIFGSVAYAVTSRRHEIGVRMALGSAPREATTLLARREMTVVIAGVLAGVVGSFGVTRLLRSFVEGTSVTNPWIFVNAALVMIGVASLAAYLPARRASRVDPMIALRSE